MLYYDNITSTCGQNVPDKQARMSCVCQWCVSQSRWTRTSMDQEADPTHRKFNGFADLFITWVVAGRASGLDIMCLHNCTTHLLNLRSSQLTERSCSLFFLNTERCVWQPYISEPSISHEPSFSQTPTLINHKLYLDKDFYILWAPVTNSVFLSYWAL